MDSGDVTEMGKDVQNVKDAEELKQVIDEVFDNDPPDQLSRVVVLDDDHAISERVQNMLTLLEEVVGKDGYTRGSYTLKPSGYITLTGGVNAFIKAFPFYESYPTVSEVRIRIM